MVICKYFQNGNCRFGSKCVNDHIDIKQIIKSEIEAALKGSQWPLSCFGPFKEKSCIPNFIDDQSFEEIRYLCYEAKNQNCFLQFQQQFNQQIIEGHNKMNQLLSLSPEVVNIVSQIYESGIEVNKAASATNNPFSNMGGNSASNSNLFGSNQVQSNPFAKSITTGFVGSTAGPTSNIFSSSISTGQSGNNSIFGNTPSIFGGAQPQNFQPSPFGGGFSSQKSQNIFGGQAQQQPNSIFGGNSNQTNFQQGQSFGSVFGSSNNASSNVGNLVSNQPMQSNMFQGANPPNAFEQMQTTQQTTFNTANQSQNTGFINQSNQNKSFAFSSFLQSTNQQGQSQVGQIQQGQPQGQSFGQQMDSGIFGNSSQNYSQIQNSNNQNTNMNSIDSVGQSQNQMQSQNVNQTQGQIQNQIQQQIQSQPQNQPQISSQSQNQQNTSIFAQAVQQQQNVPQQSLFTQGNQNQTQQSHSSVFGNQQIQTSTGNLAHSTYSTDSSSQNIFAQAAASLMQESSKPNQYSSVQLSQVNQQTYPSVYSKLETLPAQALEAFKADQFSLGKIPTIPPPKELCF